MINVRNACPEDFELLYKWANDEDVRKQSFRSDKIELEQHKIWFDKKINDENCSIFIFEDQNIALGQVRIEKINEQDSIIGISIDYLYRGKGYSTQLIQIACEKYSKNNKFCRINAYVKIENLASKKAFQNAGFDFLEEVDYENNISCHFIKILE
jgi:RimJ/RimL family protein N-acetyltransferase